MLGEVLRGFIEKVRGSGFRALIVVNSCSIENAVSVISREVRGDCLLVATQGLRGKGLCRMELSPQYFERALGSEFTAAIIALEGLLRPNVAAGVAETVRGGGFLAIVTPPRGRWNPGPPRGRGVYSVYLKRSIGECRAHLWVEWCDGVEVVSRRFEVEAWREREEVRFKSRVGVPRPLAALARTSSQAEALEVLARFFKSRARTAVVKGDRGRGKSFVVGLALALAVYWHAIGRAVVVGPTPASVSSLMRGLETGLEALGLSRRSKVVKDSEGYIVRVTGPWFRISYESPEEAEPAPLTVVDEAASVGVARVKRFSWKGGKLIVSTTIHGYEGSGRAFERILPRLLAKPMVEVELREPIRYPPGDPLEEWVYKTFMLKTEPSEPHDRLADIECREVDVKSAAESGSFRELYSILVQAHYRNTPDDMMALMESRHHHIHALYASGKPVAVADVVEESDRVDPEARIALDKLRLQAGSDDIWGFRISRIAVHPGLQRRGLGSKLVSCIEGWARSRGAQIITTMFSRHDVIEFWIKNGFKPYYISPRYNRFTGEKNIAMAKPLGGEAARLVEEASSAMMHRLLIAGSSVYRDLAAEKIAVMIPAMGPSAPPLGLTRPQATMLCRYLRGAVDMEQAMDAVWIAVVYGLSKLRPIPLSRENLTLVIARVIQGKPLNEVASIGGLAIYEAQKRVDTAVRLLLEAVVEEGGLMIDC